MAESVTVLAKAGGQEEEWRCFQRWGGVSVVAAGWCLPFKLGGGRRIGGVAGGGMQARLEVLIVKVCNEGLEIGQKWRGWCLES